MRRIDYAISMIKRSITRLLRDPLTPATASDDVPDYLDDLATKHSADDSDFAHLLISLPHDGFQRALVRQLLPQELVVRVLDYRD